MSTFNDAVISQGGILDTDTLPEALRWLAEQTMSLCVQSRDRINSSDILYPLGDLEIALVNNDQLNAFAHYNDGREGIAIYSGLFRKIASRSSQLWSEKGLLGESKCGARAISMLERLVPEESITQWKLIRDTPLSDEDKAQRCINTVVTAIHFIFMHEVGHIVQAHIPLLDEKVPIQVQTLFEHSNSDSVMAFAGLQSLEVDADQHAVRAVVDFAMTTWGMGKIYPIDFDYYKGDVFTYLVDIFRGLAVAFFSMDEHSVLKSKNATGSHPVPGVRSALASVDASTLLSHPFKITKNMAMSAALTAYMEVGDMYTQLGLNALTMEYDYRELLKAGMQVLESGTELLSDKNRFVDRRLVSFGADPKKFENFKAFYKKS